MSLFRRMLREEWRLHAEAFGSVRFGLFPTFVFAVTAGSYAFFALAGVATRELVAGLHALAFVFGLHVGTVGLVGRDAIENLLGDVTLLLFSARALPVSRTRLLGVFLAKDVVYYVALFVTPLVLAAVPVGVWRDPALLRSVPLLWATATGTFVLGMALSFALVGLYTRSRRWVVAASAALGVGTWYYGGAALRLTPYGVYREPSLAGVLASVAATGAFAAAGMALVRPGRDRRVRTARNRLPGIPGDDYGLVAKSVLEVHRSSGGVWKVVVSQALVFGVVAVVLDNVTRILPVWPAPGIAFGTLLALGGFTTYNWLTQFDDPGFYLRYPVPFGAALRAKFVAFLALSLPVSASLLVLSGAWFGFGAAGLGAFLLGTLSVYLFGVTVYLTGLAPNELLFDTPLFAAFSGALAVVLIPALVAAFAYRVASGPVTAALVVGGAVAAGVGYGLYRAAGDRWERRLRAE